MRLQRMAATKANLERVCTVLEQHKPQSLRLLTSARLAIAHGVWRESNWFCDEELNVVLEIIDLETDDLTRVTYVALFCKELEDVTEVGYFLDDLLDWRRVVAFVKVFEPTWHLLISCFDHVGQIRQYPGLCFYFDDTNTNSDDLVHNLEVLDSVKQELDEDCVLRCIKTDADLNTVVKNWFFKDTHSINRLKRQAELGLCFGLYERGRLVSWATMDETGVIGKLFTLPECRGRGFAFRCLKAALERGAELKVPPLLYTGDDNWVSRSLLEGVGLRRAKERMTWLVFVPTSLHPSKHPHFVRQG